MSAALSIQERAAAIARRTFYANPFWSDPVDPTTDDQVLWAARLEEESNAKVFERLFKSVLIIPFPIVVTFIALVIGASSDEPDSMALFVLALCGTVGVAIVLFGWIVAAKSPAQNAIEAVRQQSWQRYQNYVSWVGANDAAKYGQIVQWHQNQEMIRLQQEAADRQRQMLANQERMIKQQQETNHRLWVAEHDRRNRYR